jgi:hypothetical protein
MYHLQPLAFELGDTGSILDEFMTEIAPEQVSLRASSFLFPSNHSVEKVRKVKLSMKETAEAHRFVRRRGSHIF